MILAVDPGLANLGWAIVRPADAGVHELGVLRSKPTPGLARSADRRERAARQAAVLLGLGRAHGCTTVIGEAMSFPRGIEGIASMALSWGVLCGVATALGARLLEVTPKVWQHAVTPGKRAIVYADVEAALDAHIRRHGAPQACEQLDALPRSFRTHALDAAGVGIWAAIHP